MRYWGRPVREKLDQLYVIMFSMYLIDSNLVKLDNGIAFVLFQHEK